ncbi:MAG: hypothetical protein JW804_00290 [Sedimentisphaerales bacterium]|nr:hypothetical protein [Sedimentisphaerales bacterium]
MRLLKPVILLFFLSLPVFGLNDPQKKTAGIIVESSLPPRYKSGLADSATAAAQAYFTHLNDEYFKLKPAELAEPLKVYLSLTLADARGLIGNHGYLAEAGDAFYVPSINAAYAYLKENADDRISWDGLFMPVAEYYVHKRFASAPMWFKYGLTTSLSKNVQINDSELVLSGLCPKESLILLGEVEKETRLTVKKLFVTRDEVFGRNEETPGDINDISERGSWKIGKPFSRLLFCWLYKTGNLKQYIINVYKKGCKLEVLEDTVSTTQGKINMDLTKFIKDDCAAMANLAKAEQADGLEQKEALLAETIDLIPDHWQARIALARLYYKSGRKSQCRQILEPLLIRDDKLFYFTAAKLTAACLYDNGDYTDALEYYQKLWERSKFYPYKYQIAYKIANCNNYLDKPKEAAKWYAEFLDLNWFTEGDTKTTEYAGKYVETFGECKAADERTY